MHEGFCHARKIITALLISQICVGVCLIVTTFVYQGILGGYLPVVDRTVLYGQFYTIYILGTQLILAYTGGCMMWTILWNRRYTPNVRLMLYMWMLYCSIIVFAGLGTVWSIFTSAYAIEKMVENSLKKGINEYYACPEWKLLWDAIQFDRECCGVHSFRDWMNASWIPDDLITDDSREARHEHRVIEDGSGTYCTEEKRTITLAPYSCCKHNCNTCVGSTAHGTPGMPVLNFAQINPEGCMLRFQSSMWHAVYVLVGFMIMAFKSDVMLCFFTKLLMNKQNCESPDYSYSNLNAVDEEGNPMVVVQCPPHVRCVSIEHEEDGSRDAAGGHQSDACVDRDVCIPLNRCSSEESIAFPAPTKKSRYKQWGNAIGKSCKGHH